VVQTLPNHLETCPECGASYVCPCPDGKPWRAPGHVQCHVCGMDLTRPPSAPELNVPSEWRHGVTPKRRHLRRCYERAFSYVLSHADINGIRLVHGTYQGGLGYAWVEVGDIAFDPNHQRFYDRNRYYAATGGRKCIEYSTEDAARRSMQSGHAGPWAADGFAGSAGSTNE
jgi:hypothetical protein